MNDAIPDIQKDSEARPLEADDDQHDDEISEYEKYTFIKRIRLDINPLKKYCTPEEMALAIGGDFTGDLVNDICNDDSQPIKKIRRHGKEYIHIDTILGKLKAGLVFEDAPAEQ